MPPKKGQRHIVLREKETAIVFSEPDSRLSAGLATLNAAMNVLVSAKNLGLITPDEGMEAFKKLAKALTPITRPEKTKGD